MARALVQGMMSRPELLREINAFDINEAACEAFRNVSVTAKIRASNQEVCDHSDLVVLAVKPQKFNEAFSAIRLKDDTILLSVMAGVSIAQIKAQTNAMKIVRTMPNTPCLVGQGAIGLSATEQMGSEAIERIKSLLAGAGLVVEVEEKMLDAITGLSGSGPAFVLEFLQAMTSGGILAGIPQQLSQSLALQTIVGTCELVKQTQIHPAQLQEQVTSPGGTTIHGLHALRNNAFKASVEEAVLSATRRAIELGS